MLATLYSSESGEQIIEATAVEVPAKAVLIRAEDAEAAVAVRQRRADPGRACDGGRWSADLAGKPGPAPAGRRVSRQERARYGRVRLAISRCSDDPDWFLEVVPYTYETWQETIWITDDGRTAIHIIEHPALDAAHVAVHGADTAVVVAAFAETGDLARINGPPASLHRTGP
ncbi:hypothetical protein [Actinoallomurus iriomotensis]|uniref:Uncharacterized protein n=1 Tax=Actinoallomurus iriomotensis TaxID=478107 RepID=A0A9W6W536_9ACTN|nr:hypothetical protein [Actinoallomurus iriomotensis]GLY89631.1 hypothetical protein Airi02_075600 [Actinoallomurus iriomotensis]